MFDYVTYTHFFPGKVLYTVSNAYTFPTEIVC